MNRQVGGRSPRPTSGGAAIGRRINSAASAAPKREIVQVRVLPGEMGGNGSIKRQFLRDAQPEFAMCCRENKTAIGEMGSHEAGQADLAGAVEGAGRLVEEPDRPFDDEEPRDRKTPALAGRKISCRQSCNSAKPNRVERVVYFDCTVAKLRLGRSRLAPWSKRICAASACPMATMTPEPH
jgi:hypothetical protein